MKFEVDVDMFTLRKLLFLPSSVSQLTLSQSHVEILILVFKSLHTVAF